MKQTFDLESLVKDHHKHFMKTMKWNGWGSSDKDKKKWEKYRASWVEWDKKKIEELNLKEYLGEEILNDLLFCLNKDEHNLGITFRALVNEIEDSGYETEDGHFVLHTREETLEIIHNWKWKIQFKENAYYCCFRFTTKIKECFYAGSFLKHNEKMNMKDGIELLDEMLDSEEGFMPTLSKQIENFIGENNFISDYYEFGQNDFGLYWFIKKDIFESVIDKFSGWIKYEELQNYFLYYLITEKENDMTNTVQYDINKNEIKLKWL